MLARRHLTALPFLFLFLLAPVVPQLTATAAAAKKPSWSERRAEKEAIKKLPEKYRQWLQVVELLISDQELTTFLSLDKDYQRDAFIKRFWDERDPIRSTSRNEFRDRWEASVEQAMSLFGTLNDDRSRVLLLNGPPSDRLEAHCSSIVWPIEVWYFARAERTRSELIVVFYRKWGAGPFRVWSAEDGAGELFSGGAADSGTHDLAAIASGCRDGDRIAGGISWVLNQGMGYSMMEAQMLSKPDDQTGEWVASFNAYSTDLDGGTPPLPAKLSIDFPGRYQNRTAVEGLVSVPTSGATQSSLAGAHTYDLLLNGEVLQNGELFDSFRYKYDLPTPAAPAAATAATAGTATAAAKTNPESANLPLIFQRFLRPGEYLLIVKVVDINSKKAFREERTITVPAVDRIAPAPQRSDPDTASARLLEEANAAISTGDTTLKLVQPFGELLTGMQRFDTLTTGSNIGNVVFSLDGKPVLTKKRPPFSVELDLGSLPRPRRLTALAYDLAGNQVAGDEMTINSAANRFQVRLAEPQRGKHYENSLLARADVQVPDGQTIERVEFYLNESRVATVYQPPYQQPILLPKGQEISYVRAVAFLPDGNSTENLVFVNAPENMAELNVNFVELYTSVFDRQGHPAAGLTQKDFAVSEDGARQEIARFERVTDLPIHAAVAIDVSASMDKSIDKARQAALQFLQGTIRPKDRAAVITFNDHPNLAVKFTNDIPALATGLAGLKAERGTALYDSIIFTLYYFTGVKGQRALLLLTDGKDEGSRFTFDDALEYARRAGVTIYAIGLGDDPDKRKLEKISGETGGRAFFLKSVDELAGIYATVEAELRSQYLIAYQSTNASGGNTFRSVDLKVNKPGLEAKTIRGYYP
ncbi:MAG TPA: VWA domain-containing protein [Thermoanaerobaculia bacterium]